MARIVKNSDTTKITCLVTTVFEDDTTSVKEIAVGDIVENLRYIQDEKVLKVTGKVTSIKTIVTKVTYVDPKKPENYFNKDVQVQSIVIDASEQYASNIVTVPAMEIVEDEGVVNVKRMRVEAKCYELMDMEYTDGSIVNQDIEIGDVLQNTVIMTTPGNPDVTGTFKIVAWYYKLTKGALDVVGVYLKNVDTGAFVQATFKNFISFDEASHSDVTDPNSMAQIAAALNESDVVFAQLDVDVTIPKRDDGKITTTMIGAGKELNIDLNGHSIDCEAYAFYVNGGTLNITGDGIIKGHHAGDAYPAVFVAAGGTCNMSGGSIDTTEVIEEPDKPNWLYGVVCSGDGVFNMTGGSMKIGGASGISITNGTASGSGSQFIIGGDSVIESVACGAVYMADNKSVVIKDNAKIIGGIVARMGDFTIQDNAIVKSTSDPNAPANLGVQACISGVDTPKAGFLALTGVYRSDLGNDMNVTVKGNAKIQGNIDDAIDVAFVNTKYDQKVVFNIESDKNLEGKSTGWKVYSHDELAELATEGGKTLGAETASTDLTIKIGEATVYPVA